jgi:transcriptional regulator with XRE-family HTH domain
LSTLRNRNTALTEFLRSRREQLTPADAGLPASARRKVRGLRREEVALLADLGIAWYTWLEQGRPIRMSAEALDRVAAALQLNDQERRYLHALVAANAERCAPWDDDVPSHIQSLVSAFWAGPAYVLNPLWDVIAWNDRYARLYETFGLGPIARHNMLRMFFTTAPARAMIVDWEAAARRFVAMFRADYGRYAGEPQFEDLIAALSSASDEFAHAWARIEVDAPEQAVLNELHDPLEGHIFQRIVTLSIPEAPEFSVAFHVPVTGTG